MDEVVGKNKADRRYVSSLVAGLCGLAAALVLLVLALRVQQFLPVWYTRLLVFAIPVPIACGIAVGLASPRKAIAWAPLWAGIVGGTLLTVLSGSTSDIGMALSPARITCVCAGALLAAGAGLLGQIAVERVLVGKTVAGLVLTCLVMGGVGWIAYGNQIKDFQAHAAPEVLLEVDRDYIALPAGLDWRCERLTESGCYVLSSRLDGRAIRVVVSASAGALDHIEYSTARTQVLGTPASVRQYLHDVGVRHALLAGLAKGKKPGEWQAVFRGTELSVANDGMIRMAGVRTGGGVSREVD